MQRIDELIELGCRDVSEATQRLGIKRDSVYMACRRAGRLDAWEALTATTTTTRYRYATRRIAS